MRDLDQAEALGMDTSDMVVVTHPDKQARYGGGLAQFTMTRLSYIKRGLAAKGYEIAGDATQAAPLSAREQSMMAELEQLRAQMAAGQPAASASDREQLEAEATALEMKVDKRWSDETLAKKIAEARAVADLDDEDFD
jgi:hypothetical protein